MKKIGFDNSAPTRVLGMKNHERRIYTVDENHARRKSMIGILGAFSRPLQTVVLISNGNKNNKKGLLMASKFKSHSITTKAVENGSI